MNIENYIPEKKIRSILNIKCSMVFNKGTSGPEQKITALGYDSNSYFFLKYGESSQAMRNIINEKNTLDKLINLDFVPKVLSFYSDDYSVLLKTNVLHGTKLGFENPSILLPYLFKIQQIKLNNKSKSSKDIKIAFAHGDFCPWNMMEEKGKILVFDWEMAGMYPFGFDLFTYIFQSNFLLRKNWKIEFIIRDASGIIDEYFDYLNIYNWEPYLKEFAEIKIQTEKGKGSGVLLNSYQILLNYLKRYD